MSELELRPLFSFPRFIAGGLGDLNLGEVGEAADNGLDLAVRGGGGGGGGGGVFGLIFLSEFRRCNVVGTDCEIREAEVEEIIFVSRGHIILLVFLNVLWSKRKGGVGMTG